MIVIKNENAHWTIDKRIPIALVFAVIAQTIGAVWWAATINARMAQFEAIISAMADQNGRIIKLEAVGEQTTKALDHIEAKIDKVLESPPKLK